MLKSTHLLCLVLVSNFVFSQADTIRLKNPSFEDSPKRGGETNEAIIGWFDCGKGKFPKESPPDIHPKGYWQNNLPAAHGKTYIGMVVRDNVTYESVSAKLDHEMKTNSTYSVSLYLAQAEKYFSLSRITKEVNNYTTPTVLKIWGGYGICNEKELLYESPPIDHKEWQKYEILLKPIRDCNSITFSAYYVQNTEIAYNGNILLDNISDIIRVK